MFTCPPSQGLLLPVISPLRRRSGRSPSYWPAGRQTRLQKPMSARKELHLQTFAGLRFEICSYVGSSTWDASAVKILHHVARGNATRTGEESAASTSLLFQQLGVTIRSYQARAALRRRVLRFKQPGSTAEGANRIKAMSARVNVI